MKTDQNYSAQNAMGWMQVVSAVANGMLQRGLTKAQNRLAAANAAAINTVTRANNELQAAESTYARWAQSVSNQRRLRTSGKQFDAANESLARMQDSRTAGSVSRKVQAAEEQGVLAARAAFAGVVGSGNDVIAGTAALRAALVEDQAQRTGGQQEYEIASRVGRTVSEGLEGLDNTAILSNLNKNTASPHERVVTGNVITDVLGSGADFGAMARYFRLGTKPDPAEGIDYSNEGRNYPSIQVR